MDARLFDLDLLRTFLAVADCGSFTVAARRLNSTQSTVSQKVLRLEAMAGQSLLQRSRRDVQPTDAGERLISYARRMLTLNEEAVADLSGARVATTLRIGVPEDFAAGRTVRMLAEFCRRNSQVKLELTSGLSRDLRARYDRGELDMAVVKQRRNRGEGALRWPETLCWIDSATSPAAGRKPLPLVVFPAGGLYRDDMTATLDGLGRQWLIGYTSSSLASICAAVAEGMGISLVPRRVVTAGHIVLGAESGLPSVATMEIAIHHRPDADSLVRELATGFANISQEPSRRLQP